MQKARGHTTRMLPQLVSIWFQVLFTPLIGVLFIIQSPYWFTIGRWGVLSLTGWTPLYSHRVSRAPCYSLGCFNMLSFPYRTITFFGVPFQILQGITNINSHRADPLSLAATYGVAFAFLSYSYWDVSVHCVRPHTVCIRVWVICSTDWVSPFGDSKISAWLPAPLDLSQVPTSFIASQRQDIHHMPLTTWSCRPDFDNTSLPKSKSTCHDWVCKGLSQSMQQEDSCCNFLLEKPVKVDGQTIHNEYFQIALKKIILIKKHN